MTAEAWLQRLRRLNVYRAKHGPAPHKPLLLLVLLFLVERREVLSQTFRLSAEVAFHFETFWSVVAHRRSQRGDVRLPFFHLRSDGIWLVFDESGAPAQRRETSSYAVIDDEFFGLLADSVFLACAREALIRSHFRADEQVALWEIFGISADMVHAATGHPEQSDLPKRAGRGARFRLEVVSAYEYSCALTGYRITTVGFGTLVDAAHIHAYSHSRNNDPRNGIALSKNAHWLFDAGLWTLTDDYRVLVAVEQLLEHSPHQRPLSEFHGERIGLPAKPDLWPDPAFIRWHRQHRFASVRHHR